MVAHPQAGPHPGLALVERLRLELMTASFKYPGLEAVVTFRPVRRRAEAERVALAHGHTPEGATQYATRLARDMPSDWEHPNKRGGVFWEQVVRGPGGRGVRWEAALFGDTRHTSGDLAFRKFEPMARTAYHLCRPGVETGGADPLALWLILLARQDTPLDPLAGRYRLEWSPGGGPRWVRAASGPDEWWTARIVNVFLASNIVLGRGVAGAAGQEGGGGLGGRPAEEPAGRPESPPPPAQRPTGRRPTANAAVLDLLSRKGREVYEWPAQKIADEVGYSKTAVLGTTAWGEIGKAREEMRAARRPAAVGGRRSVGK